ncbi:MAG: peptide chain release factor N(5)-glutamine methyltransferase [Alphaproteobacteria bacterium]|nr:peptide chain release factor N(5)-glutamine methyltransferase [Alphaproteobacteria bacterium]
MATVRATLADATAALAAAGIDSAALDARLLLADALALPATRLLLEPMRVVSPAERQRFRRRLQRRLQREPVSRIRGEREFWSLPLAISAATLDPRPDSETLVAAVLARCPAPRRALDLGTGSGALILALASERPQMTALGLDISLGALRVARANAQRLGLAGRVRFAKGGWSDQRLVVPRGAGVFDLILSNPPYIATPDLAGLAPEVGFDPRTALDGGPDGLAPYRVILGDIGRALGPGGRVAFEIGLTQGPAVADLCRQAGLSEIEVLPDLGGRDRVVTATRVGVG